MKKRPDELDADEENTRSPKQTAADERHRVIADYVEALRELIRKLRKPFHWAV